MDIGEAAAVFCSAVEKQDAEEAMTACTRSGWEGAGDSAAALYQVALARGLRLVIEPESRWIRGDRAASRLGVYNGEQRLGAAFLLLEKGMNGWHIGGMSQHAQVVPLFLDGRLPARVNWRELPNSPAAEAWASRLIERLRGGEEAMDAASEGLIPVLNHVIRSAEGLGTGRVLRSILLGARAGVGIELHAPGELAQERWLFVDVNDTSVVPVYLALRPEVPALLYQMPTPEDWAAAREERKVDLDGILKKLVTPG